MNRLKEAQKAYHNARRHRLTNPSSYFKAVKNLGLEYSIASAHEATTRKQQTTWFRKSVQYKLAAEAFRQQHSEGVYW